MGVKFLPDARMTASTAQPFRHRAHIYGKVERVADASEQAQNEESRLHGETASILRRSRSSLALAAVAMYACGPNSIVFTGIAPTGAGGASITTTTTVPSTATSGIGGGSEGSGP